MLLFWSHGDYSSMFLICSISLKSILVPVILSPIYGSVLSMITPDTQVPLGVGSGVRWKEHALEANDSVFHPVIARAT